MLGIVVNGFSEIQGSGSVGWWSLWPAFIKNLGANTSPFDGFTVSLERFICTL